MSDGKIKVFDLASELNIRSLELVEKLNSLGINVKSHMSSITSDEADLARTKLKSKEKVVAKEEKVAKTQKKTIIRKRSKKSEPEPEPETKPEIKDEAVKKDATSKNKEKVDQSEDLLLGKAKQDIVPDKLIEKPSKKAKTFETAPVEPEPKKKEIKKKNTKREVKREVVNVREIKHVVTGRAQYGQKRKPQTGKQHKKTLITTMKESKRKIRINTENVVVADLAKEMGVKTSEIVKKLFEYGVMVTQNQSIDLETAKSVASDFSYALEFVGFEESNVIVEKTDDEKDLKTRPPVVTMMGHVDHGKTSILDAIRESRVVDKEAGGITQHIGAYEVVIPKGSITFIDTPGHEAFTQMRARGSQLTDIVVLVIAADDGVMPQTRESIAHAKAAGVEVVVAVNKVDRPQANVERVKQQLAELDLLCEDWGGQTILVPTSAIKKEGIDKLLEAILLQAELMELKANPSREPEGIVVEAKLDKGMGPVATIIIQNGTLKVGDYLVAGTSYGRIKSIKNSFSASIKKLLPSQPGEILGLNVVPEAGDKIYHVKNESDAKKLISHRIEEQRKSSEAATTGAPLSLDDLMNNAENELKIVNLLVKADTRGSAEALNASLLNLSDNEVNVNVIYVGTGGVTVNDVNLALASNAIIIAFNVRPDTNAFKEASRAKVEIRNYSIIYKCLEDVERFKKASLDPIEKETVNGHALVRQTFSVPKVGVIAGCGVSDGKIIRNSQIRITRDGVIIYTGKIKSLKHFKDDVKEIGSGNECGIGVEGFNDIKIGDLMESFSISFVNQE